MQIIRIRIIRQITWRSPHFNTPCSQQGILEKVYTRAGGALGGREERWSQGIIFETIGETSSGFNCYPCFFCFFICLNYVFSA